MASYQWQASFGGGGGGAGLSSINGDTTAAQLLTVGTAGTNFAIVDAGSGSHVFNLPTASASNRGALSSADWSSFSAKQSALTIGDLTESGSANLTVTGGTGAVIGSGVLLTLTGATLLETTSSVLTITGGTNAVLGTGVTIQVKQASTSTSGYLSNVDWNIFQGKQAAGNYITALTGDITASGPGSAASTLATVNSNVGSFTNANITVNAKGLVTAAANGSAATGTVTSVAMTLPSSLFTTPPTGSPITTTGTLALALATQNANLLFAGPSSGSAATPTFRAAVPLDITIPATAKSVSYALTNADQTVNFTTSTSALTATLPTAVGFSGKRFTINKVDSAVGTVALATTSSQTIGGIATGVILLGTITDSITLESDGANWQIINFGIFYGSIVNGTVSGTLNGSFNAAKFATIVNDPWGSYNTSTGAWTAAIPGYYDVSAQLDISATFTTGQFVNVSIGINSTSSPSYLASSQSQVVAAGEFFVPINVNAIKLATGDIIYLQSRSNATSPTYGSGTTAFFSIARRK